MPLTNRLIASRSPRARARLLRGAEEVELPIGAVLYDAGAPLTHTYFPRSGFISLMATLDTHKPLGLGLIGSEGMLGATMLLNVGLAPMRSVVQGSGTAWRISTAQLRSELDRNPGFAGKLRSYLYLTLLQLAQNSACLSFHFVDARLARWLLMTHDRTAGDKFRLTHAFLADMLGVRRSAVTLSAGRLQRSKIIRYCRGEISVLARDELEAQACSCYATGIEAYTKCMT